MNHNTAQPSQFLCIPSLPLAVYREVAAHLRQVEGVEVELVNQTASTFDYRQSQTAGLVLHWAIGGNEVDQQRVQQILDYYGKRYGNWQPLN